MNKQLKVVIADDTSEFGQKCAKILKGYGMEVELCVKDGFEVIKTIQRQKPNVVVADVFMPGLDILGVLNSLKDMNEKDRPLIMAMSGFDNPRLEKQALDAGAAYYFLIHPRILHAIDWLSRNLAFSFVIGLFYGVFLIDVVYSTKLIHRIKKLADENEVIVKYENLKAHVRSVHDRSAQKASFFFPLRSERPLNEHLRELRETLEQRRRTGGKKHAG